MEALHAIAQAAEALAVDLDERFKVAGSAYNLHLEAVERQVNTWSTELRAVGDDLAAFKTATGEAVRAQAEANRDLRERADLYAEDADNRFLALNEAGASVVVEVEALKALVGAQAKAAAEESNAVKQRVEAIDARLASVEGLVRLLAGTLAPAEEPAAKPTRVGRTAKSGG